MKCPYCEREVNIELTEKLEVWGIIQERRCPRCKMLISAHLKGLNEMRKGRLPGLTHIKEILKEIKYK